MDAGIINCGAWQHEERVYRYAEHLGCKVTISDLALQIMAGAILLPVVTLWPR